MRQFLNIPKNIAKTLSIAALFSSSLVVTNVIATRAESINNHTEQVSWSLPTDTPTAHSHADVISWECTPDHQISTSHIYGVSEFKNIEMAGN